MTSTISPRRPRPGASATRTWSWRSRSILAGAAPPWSSRTTTPTVTFPWCAAPEPEMSSSPVSGTTNAVGSPWAWSGIPPPGGTVTYAAAGCPAPACSSTSTSAIGPWGNAIPADRSGAGGQHSHRPLPGSGAGWVTGDQGGVRAYPADLGRSPGGVQRPGPAGQRLGEEPGVVGGEVGPLSGDVVLVEDGLDRADRLASAAVDALVRLDVERSLPFVDAVDRALFDAGSVQHVDARLGDDVGHPLLLSIRSRWIMCEFIGQPTFLLGSGRDRCDRPGGLGSGPGRSREHHLRPYQPDRGYRAGSGHRSPVLPGGRGTSAMHRSGLTNGRSWAWAGGTPSRCSAPRSSPRCIAQTTWG